MKKFNIIDALSGMKVTNGFGMEVKNIIIITGLKKGKQPVLGVLDGELMTWDLDGSFHTDGRPSDMDLVLAPETETETDVIPYPF